VQCLFAPFYPSIQGCGSGSWKRKRLNFCGSGSTLKKLEAEANSEAFNFLRSRKRKHFSLNMGQGCGSGYIFVEAEAKILYCFHIPVSITRKRWHRYPLIRWVFTSFQLIRNLFEAIKQTHYSSHKAMNQRIGYSNVTRVKGRFLVHARFFVNKLDLV